MYGGAWERIDRLVRAATPIRAGMLDLISLCERVRAAPVWASFRALDFESEQESLAAWVRGLLADEPPPPSINGLWFGLFNPFLDDGQPTCCLYLAGSARFDPAMSDPDWACSPEYFPEGRCSASEVLTTIYRAANAVDGEVGAQAEYALCLGYSCLVVAEWCRGPLREELSGGLAIRGITVGFDSGDGLLIDVLRSGRMA